MKAFRKFSSFRLGNINYIAVARKDKLIIFSSDNFDLTQVWFIVVLIK